MGNVRTRGTRTEQHEGSLALARLKARLREQHERLQGFDRGLINIKLQASAPCILLAHSDGSIVSTEMGCISESVRLIGRARVVNDQTYLALTA